MSLNLMVLYLSADTSGKRRVTVVTAVGFMTTPDVRDPLTITRKNAPERPTDAGRPPR
jgi:hypothetical protein